MHRGKARRAPAIGLVILINATTALAQAEPETGLLRQAQGFGPSGQCALRFEDLWDCAAGRWGDAAQDTLYQNLVQVQQEIPGSVGAIEHRINGLCSADMLSWEIGRVVMSSGAQAQAVVCYVAETSWEEVKRFRTGAKTREAAQKSGDACRKFYREHFFAGLLKAYRTGQTDPVHAVCGEAFAAERVGIYAKDSPEAVVVQRMQLLSGDSCDLDCYREIMGLHSRHYLDVHKDAWVATFDREAAQGKHDSLRRLFGRGAPLDKVRTLPPLEFMARLQSRVHESVGRRARFSRVKIIAREQDSTDEVTLQVRYSGLPDVPKYEETDYVHLVREGGQWRIDR